MTTDDMALVREYAERQSEPAFETLVSRYIHLAIRFVSAHDQRGKKIDEGSGSWDKYHFWRMVDRPPRGEDAYVTIAIVPNVHMTFLTQPRLVDSKPAEN